MHPATDSNVGTPRRQFLKQATALTAGSVFYIARTSWAQKSPGETINVAIVGFKGRGSSHISGYAGLGKKGEAVRVAALCDVDSSVLNKRVAEESKGKEKVEAYTDIRKLLENKDIDAVSIATPNHWHALASIWAIQAGKDVYVEKPVSHCVWEGRQIVKAARKYGKIVQTGTQARSSREGIFGGVKFVQSGALGKIKLARGLCYKRRDSIGLAGGEQEVPSSVDYDLWCGPGPKAGLTRKKLHYDWHWTWAYGNGDLGNQGIHQMDIARWFLGEMALAPAVWSVGGRLGYKDDGETANTQIVYQGYEKAPLIFEVRGLPQKKGAKDMDKLKGAGVGVIVECENGYVVVPSYGSAIAYDSAGKEIQKWQGSGDHFANFINACRSRNIEDLHADILEGHLSSALCHTGNISYRLGEQKSPDAIAEEIKAQPFAEEAFGRMKEHLKLNEIDISSDKLTLGPVLKMDPQAERFIGNDKADEMLKNKYREPYVVPEIS